MMINVILRQKKLLITLVLTILLVISLVTIKYINKTYIKISASTANSLNYVEFGKVETVFNWNTQKCDNEDFPDSPARAIIDSDGNVQLYSANIFNRISVGPNLSETTRRCNIVHGSKFDSNPRSYNDYQWLMTPYTIDGSNIYGLVHNEYHGYMHDNCNDNTDNKILNCWWNSINLVKSSNKGAIFTQANSPENNIANTSINFDPSNKLKNIGFFHPSNIIFRNGYYYATTFVQIPINGSFNYKRCLMRTNNLEDASSWRFFDGVNFTIPTRGVPANGDCVNIDTGDFDLHWNTYLNAYTSLIGIVQKNAIKISQNLTEWNETFNFTPPSALKNQAVYQTFIQPGAETRNFEDIGRSPWLYFVTCGDDKQNCNSFTDNNRDLKRIRVRFNKKEDIGKYDVLDLCFNEYKGSKTLDSSFYGNDAVVHPGASLTQSGPDKFINFNGSGKVVVPNNQSLNLVKDFSISVKIRTNQNPAISTSSPSSIFVKEDLVNKYKYGLYLQNGGRINFSLSNGSSTTTVSTSKSINDGVWHNVLVIYQPSLNKTMIYIDGVLNKSVVNRSFKSNISNSGDIVIGNKFIGDIDKFTIYNHVRTPEINLSTLNTGLNESNQQSPSIIYELAYNSDIIFTSQSQERKLLEQSGYTLMKTPFKAYQIQLNQDMVPLYRLYSKTTGQHFFTTSNSEKDSFVDIGWIMEGVSFYVYIDDKPERTPVYRLYNSNLKTYIWTSSSAEISKYTKSGYSIEGVAFYVLL